MTMLLETVGHVTQMVKGLQEMGLEVPTPRLVFTGSNKSGVRTVAESVMGMKLIPYNLCYPFEIRFVQVSGKADIICHVNFNLKRYEFPADAWNLKQDIEHHVKSLSDPALKEEEKIILTVESSRVPDLHVLENCNEDISKLSCSDIAVFVIAANNHPTEKVLEMLKMCWKPTIGVLTKIDMVDPQVVSKMLIDNSLSLPFGLTGFVYNKQLGSDWLTRHSVYSTLPSDSRGVEAVIKRVGLELTARYVEILNGMKGDIDLKMTTLKKCTAISEQHESNLKQLKILEEVENFIA